MFQFPVAGRHDDLEGTAVHLEPDGRQHHLTLTVVQPEGSGRRGL